MNEEIIQKLNEHGEKIEEIRKSIDKMRKYFLWTLIITVVTIVVPLIAIVAIIPWFLKIITSAYSGIGI
jgi:hypothetical protein